jgi:hypothetical protein
MVSLSAASSLLPLVQSSFDFGIWFNLILSVLCFICCPLVGTIFSFVLVCRRHEHVLHSCFWHVFYLFWALLWLELLCFWHVLYLSKPCFGLNSWLLLALSPASYLYYGCFLDDSVHMFAWCPQRHLIF